MAQKISPSRLWAVNALEAIFEQGMSMDAVLENGDTFMAMSQRDRALARAIAGTALRRSGQIDTVLAAYMDRPLPKKAGWMRAILRTASAEILFLRSPAFAVVSEAVSMAARERTSRPFKALGNAVLRKVANTGAKRLRDIPQTLNIPLWLRQSWTAAYGADAVQQAAAVLAQAPPADVTVFGEIAPWVKALGGAALGPSCLRLEATARPVGPVSAWPGFAEGAWQVQDAAASLPALILNVRPGERVADLCAAPGGKSAQLAARGADVRALDRNRRRLHRLEQNLHRLRLGVQPLCADALTWQPEAPLDAVLLDAPCSASGVFRRHPDVLVLKTPAQVKALTQTQFALARAAAAMLRQGGRLVYCVCSAEPEEGEKLAALLLRELPLQKQPIAPQTLPFGREFCSGNMVRIPPGAWAERGGLDAFFMAAFVRK